MKYLLNSSLYFFKNSCKKSSYFVQLKKNLDTASNTYHQNQRGKLQEKLTACQEVDENQKKISYSGRDLYTFHNATHQKPLTCDHFK